MKYITLIIGLMVVGCGNSVEVDPYGTETYDPHKERDDTTEKPVKELTLREKVLGTYETKKDGETKKFVLHENGKHEAWIDGEKKDDGTWKFEAKEVYVNILEDGKEITYILKIESNGELTMIARIKDNKREEAPKQHQRTFKKLK